MTQEISDETRKASMLLEQILGDETMQDTLLTGEEKDKARIVENVCKKMVSEPTVQSAFLKMLIGTFSKENDDRDTDRRDSAYEVLNQPAIMDLLPDNSTVVFDSYLEAINQQTKDNDPFSGSIGSLLDAGKILAPYFPNDDLARKQLEHLWGQIARQFSYGGEREHIESGVAEIVEKMTLQGSIDARVEYFRGRKFKNKEIAGVLKVTDHVVEQSVSRLIDAGRLSTRRGTKSKHDSEIVQLFNEGLTPDEIAANLNEDVKTVSWRIRQLREYGMIGYKERQKQVKVRPESDKKRGRPRIEELSVRDKKVAFLRKKGLKYIEIAAVLNITIKRAENSFQRFSHWKKMMNVESDVVLGDLADESSKLIPPENSFAVDPGLSEVNTGNAQSMKGYASGDLNEEGVRQQERFFDLRVLLLRKHGLQRKEIAAIMGVPSVKSIEESISRLRAENKLQPIRTPAEITHIDEQVELFKKQGYGNAEIANQMSEELRVVVESVSRLRNQGRLPGSSEESRRSLRTKKLDDMVEILSKQGLQRRQIARELKRNPDDIAHSLARLRVRGRIEKPVKGSQRPPHSKELDDKVEPLKKQGLSNAKIAELLNIKNVRKIEYAIVRLRENGRLELPESTLTQQEKDELDEKVVQLVMAGAKRKEIVRGLKFSDTEIKNSLSRLRYKNRKMWTETQR